MTTPTRFASTTLNDLIESLLDIRSSSTRCADSLRNEAVEALSQRDLSDMMDQEAPAPDADADAILLLARRSEERLLDVDRALERVADGTYGYCTACGSKIPLRRLRALPFTPFCVRCSNDRTGRGVASFASQSAGVLDEPDPRSSSPFEETST